MGVFAGPDVSESGLVLALDAANSKGFDDDENLRTNSDTGGFFPVVGTWTSTATSTDISAPNGSSTTYKVVSAGGGQASIDIAYQQITLTAGVTYTVSAHFYATGSTTTSRTIGIAIFGNGLSGTGPIILPQNQWVRRSFTFTATTTSNTGQIRIIDNDTSGFNTTNGAVIYLWGAQLETGSTVSSYYPTTASVKNRGTTLIDMTGRGNTGTLTNGPTYSSTNGGTIVFDGTNDVVTFPNNTISTTAGITVEVWFKTSSGTKYQDIFDLADAYGIWITTNYPSVGTGKITASFNTTTGIMSVNYSVDTWYQVVISGSGTSNTLYLNGVGVSTASQTVATSINLNTARIGNVDGDRAAEYFVGNIASLKLYNKALTAAEIQQNFNATRGRFGI